jgi:hypothetical protein
MHFRVLEELPRLMIFNMQRPHRCHILADLFVLHAYSRVQRRHFTGGRHYYGNFMPN